jgi:hypothetical protein
MGYNVVKLGNDVLIDLSGDTVSPAALLSGYTAHDKTGAVISGQMTDNGAVAPSDLAAGGSYTIPKGYHNGAGVVKAKSLSDQTTATASSSDIVSGKTAYVNGQKVTGNIADNGTVTKTLDTSTTSYTIPAGKHSGSGKVSIATQEKSVTPGTSAQTVTPDSGKVLSKVSVGAVASATQATPSISVDSAGKITASATQEAGYVAAGTKSATKQLTTKGATTITPTSSVQTAVSAGTYCTGDIKVAAASGGSAKRGTVTAQATEKLTINTGTTLSASSTFFLMFTGTSYDPVNSGDYITNIITCAVKSTQENMVTSLYANDYDGSLFPTVYNNTGKISFSGTSVTINAPNCYFIPGKYTWFVM